MDAVFGNSLQTALDGQLNLMAVLQHKHSRQGGALTWMSVVVMVASRP
jgi:hypothetical protein